MSQHFPTPSPRISHRLLALALLALHLPLAGGCSLFYRSRSAGDGFVLYADRDEKFLDSLRLDVERIYDGYRSLFDLDRDELGTTFILLDGTDQGVVDHTYAPNLLGYYVPLLNLIRVDTEPAWARDEDALHQVLLHEISHHFIVTKYPGASSECWLNEGLAGNLETSLVGVDHCEYPLMHPALARLAKKALLVEQDVPSLAELLAMNWSRFHDEERKVTHYALSWSVVYFLLSRVLPAELPLGERIERLYHMDRGAITGLEGRWRRFVRQLDLTGHLVSKSLSTDPGDEISALRAIEQLGDLYGLDDFRATRALAELFGHPDRTRRNLAYLSFLRALRRNPRIYHLADRSIRAALEQLRSIILDRQAPGELRSALIGELGPAVPLRSRWLETLVPLLETEAPDVRSAAAAALGRLAGKPTIVNPAFWRYAPLSLRTREVGEWKEWLEARGRS